jgi:phage FluMu protein Com
MTTRANTLRWRCRRCHTLLLWSPTTVGCPRCNVVVTLPRPHDESEQQR